MLQRVTMIERFQFLLLFMSVVSGSGVILEQLQQQQEWVWSTFSKI